MPFKRYVEIGRVALVNYGPEYGKLVVITDIVDQNRAVVDRPDETRRVINFKRLALTDFKIDIQRMAKKKELTAALKTNDVFTKFQQTAWGKKLAARVSKSQTTDFERYKAAVAKSKRSKAVAASLAKLQKSAK
ncbi:hypothetical protein WJX72_006581 [[Myrmecia] bisecta]|uniref:Large ribosomal subunit protein eL14 domain-containing protein n=1 Tax=[Myrmecia] bisecta TaxID=41462 RepID=A0AAW1QFC1_9CHLO